MASALSIINASYDQIGVKASGQPLKSETALDGLRRLNNMVSGWRTQYLTVLAIERTIFTLVANKQTYTIGIGGDFNVPRPMTVTGAGLWMNALASAVSVSSITRSGYVATVTKASHGLAVGDEALIAGANQQDYNGLQTVRTVPASGTWTYEVNGTPITPATGTITSATVTGQPIEIPRDVITDDMYQGIQIKNLPNSLFTGVYYNPTVPLGEIVLWPKPDTAQNQLVLYLQNVFSGFTDLYTDYSWPDTPGYGEALEFNLAPRLWPAQWGTVPVPQDIWTLANQSLATVKRSNLKLVDLPNEAAWAISGNRRFGYNINTGNG